MSRSSWKGYYVDSFLSPFSFDSSLNYFKLWSRRSTILPFLINKTVFIYNGKVFEKLTVTEEMVGFKLGDFIFTKKRGRFIHVKKDKKKSLQKKSK